MLERVKGLKSIPWGEGLTLSHILLTNIKQMIFKTSSRKYGKSLEIILHFTLFHSFCPSVGDEFSKHCDKRCNLFKMNNFSFFICRDFTYFAYTCMFMYSKLSAADFVAYGKG